MTNNLGRSRIDRLASRLIRHHEGVRHLPYEDSVGKLTIGVGRNLTDRGLSMPEIDMLYEHDYQISREILDRWVSGWQAWPLSVQLALLSMAYNLGGPRLSGFKNMRAALRAGDFVAAGLEAKNSLWARQVGSRSDEILALFRGDESVMGADDMGGLG